MAVEAAFRWAAAAERLDRALALLEPSLALRGRRRLAESFCVLVNGRPRGPAWKVRPGDEILIERPSATRPPHMPRLLRIVGEYAFFHKPAGLFSASLAGEGEASFESLAAGILAAMDFQDPIFLQRLDFATRGIICAALNRLAAQKFRQAEKAGLCEKHYLALLSGRLERPLVVKNALDCADRRKVGILKKEAGPLRWTSFRPLRAWRVGKAWRTLALCRIRLGQRHQIRAHAKSAGYPLSGDPLYGADEGEFYLEHFRLRFQACEYTYIESKDCPAAIAGALKEVWPDGMKEIF